MIAFGQSFTPPLILGLIISYHSRNESTILPRIDSWTHEFAFVNFHQSDCCLQLTSVWQHELFFAEQFSKWWMLRMLRCGVQLSFGVY